MTRRAFDLIATEHRADELAIKAAAWVYCACRFGLPALRAWARRRWGR